jgi:hypothetical protein
MSKSKLAVIAYAVSLTAVAAGTVTLFQTVVGLGPADRNALAAGQAHGALVVISPASKVAEPSKPERVEATKPKRVTQSRPRQRVAQERYDYSSYERRYHSNW